MIDLLRGDALLDTFRQRWRSGDLVSVEAFLAEHPHEIDGERLVDLLYLEAMLREERGQFPPVEEYVERFPHFRDELRKQFDVHMAMKGDHVLTTVSGVALPPPSFSRLDLPGYEIVRELGRGGMGVVYEARHCALGRTVALKMLAPERVGSPEILVRFRAEAEALARLQHPNIVQIFEIGESAGQPFFSMEFCAAGGLDRTMNGTPLPADRTTALLILLARAVQAAHQAGVVHRDLKPANVLLSVGQAFQPDSGAVRLESLTYVPKIADFGLARILDRPTRTDPGAVMGSPCYMSPEQASGAKDVGPAADVYALGAILYECLTGRPPFSGSDVMSILHQVVEAQPVPPSRLAPEVPRDLETIALKCLDKLPDRRYHTAAELADDLELFLVGQPIRARPVGALGIAHRWARRKPLAACLLASLILAVTIGLSSGILLWHGKSEQRGEAAWQQYVGSIRKADTDLQGNKSAWARRHLDRCPSAWRNWEWYHLDRAVDGEAVAAWTAHERSVHSIDFSPDGICLASAGGDGAVRLWTLEGAKRQEFVGHIGSVNTVAFRDGTTLASGAADGKAILWRRGEARPWKVLSLDRSILAVAFHPSGKRLVTVTDEPDESDISRWEVASGTRIGKSQQHDSPLHALASSPDGKRLAVARQDGLVLILEETTGRTLSNFSEHGPHPVATVAFSPDGQLVASGGGRYEPEHPDECDILLWEAATGKVIRRLTGAANRQRALAFSPDGSRLASGGWDREVRIWDVRTGEELLGLRGHTDAVTRLVFSPDGTRLASCGLDGTIRVWRGR